MSQNFHGGDFESDSRQIFAKLLLVHDLDRNFFSSQQMSRELDLGEAAGADGLVQLVLTFEGRVRGGDRQRRRQRRFTRTFRRHRWAQKKKLFHSKFSFQNPGNQNDKKIF